MEEIINSNNFNDLKDMDGPKLLIIYDDLYITKNELRGIIIKNFSHFNILQKGITFHNSEDGETIVIDNKYYKCEIKVDYASFSFMSDDKEKDLGKIEGLLIYAEKSHLDKVRMSEMLQINGENLKPNLSIVAFEDTRNELSSSANFEDFVGFAIDNNFEIIADVASLEQLDEDDGIGALNMSLQSCHWSKSQMKNQKKIEKGNAPEKDRNEIKSENQEKDGYQQLKDEAEFDNFLEKINDVRRMNMDSKLSDEERRRNAEDALLMLSKYLNFNDGEDEGGEESL